MRVKPPYQKIFCSDIVFIRRIFFLFPYLKSKKQTLTIMMTTYFWTFKLCFPTFPFLFFQCPIFCLFSSVKWKTHAFPCCLKSFLKNCGLIFILWLMTKKGWNVKEDPLGIEIVDCWVLGFVLKTNGKKKPLVVSHFWEF